MTKAVRPSTVDLTAPPPSDDSGGFRVQPVLKAREQVERQLRQAIQSGAFAQGERLPSEMELTGIFSVSRTTVREALRSLAEEGLITRTPGARGGSFVERVDHQALVGLLLKPLTSTMKLGNITSAEVVELRDLLAVAVAERAAENRQAPHLAELRRIVGQEEKAPGGGAEDDTDQRFQLALATATGNRLLTAFAATLLRSVPLATGSPGEAARHHSAILDAVERRDQVGAAAAMRALLGGREGGSGATGRRRRTTARSASR
jgi:DNA-binding FadR family transcriptional regulator